MSLQKDEQHFLDVPDECDKGENQGDGEDKRDKKKRPSNALRKAPQAPKRFKSSYICFFIAKQSEIKEQLGDQATVTSISRRSAEMWKNLSSQDRAYWDDVAAQDKQRYIHEKASYTGPWQVPWKRARKDPSAPRRPMSAFLYFSQGKRTQLKEAHPDIKNTEISRILGEMWRNLPDEERQPHIDREKEEREKYKEAISNWRKDMDEKKESRSGYVESTLTAQVPMYGGELFSVPTMPNSYNMYPGYPYVSAYSFPLNGKNPVILGPNGMPYGPANGMPHYAHNSHQTSSAASFQGQGYDDGTTTLNPHSITFDYPLDQIGEPAISDVI